MAFIPGVTDFPPRLPKGTIGDDLSLSDDMSIGGDLTLDGDLAIGGQITTVQGIQFDLTSVLASQEALLMWNADVGVFEFGLPGGEVVGQLLTEELLSRRVRNQTGSLIPNGELVKIIGATGGVLEVAPADNSNNIDARAAGMATEDIPDNGRGYITRRGSVKGSDLQPIDTSMYPEGTLLWLGKSGAFTGVRPTPPDVSVFVGIVLRQHTKRGEIGLTIIIGQLLQMLSDVLPVELQDGHTPVYVAANSRFEMTTTARMPPAEIDDGDSPYSVVATDSIILCDTSGGAIQVDLPAVADAGDRAIYVRNTSTGNVTINADDVELIDAAQTLVLGAGGKTRITPSSTQWWTLQ
ncbi:MAG: hypothetical protein ACYTEQ_06450 [Planctomycetota bacterium]|jgi:hypothetical protein